MSSTGNSSKGSRIIKKIITGVAVAALAFCYSVFSKEPPQPVELPPPVNVPEQPDEMVHSKFVKIVLTIGCVVPAIVVIALLVIELWQLFFLLFPEP